MSDAITKQDLNAALSSEIIVTKLERKGDGLTIHVEVSTPFWCPYRYPIKDTFTVRLSSELRMTAYGAIDYIRGLAGQIQSRRWQEHRQEFPFSPNACPNCGLRHPNGCIDA